MLILSARAILCNVPSSGKSTFVIFIRFTLVERSSCGRRCIFFNRGTLSLCFIHLLASHLSVICYLFLCCSLVIDLSFNSLFIFIMLSWILLEKRKNKCYFKCSPYISPYIEVFWLILILFFFLGQILFILDQTKKIRNK